MSCPSGVLEVCEVRDEPGNQFTVKFSPTEKGLNVISVKQKGIHIPGN